MYLSEKGFEEIYAHSCEHQQYLIQQQGRVHKKCGWGGKRCLDGIKITLKTLKFNYTYLHT